MDIATIMGLVLCVGAVVGSIVVHGDIVGFMDTPAILVVFFGVVGATFIKWPLEVLVKVFQIGIRHTFSLPPTFQSVIDEIGNLAETARRESVFALEKIEVDDPFLKKAMMLAADNRSSDVIVRMLQLEIDATQERHQVGQNVLQGVQEDGPAFGMIGTLIGLVTMLSNLSDQASIGPSMSIALLTTFYGTCLANIFGGPIKNKLAHRGELERIRMMIILEGTLAIVAGENPRLIKEKLTAFIPPGERDFIENYIGPS